MSQKPPRVSVYSVTDTMITIKFEIQIDGDSPDQLVIKKNGVALATVWPAEYSNGVDSWSEPRTGQKEIWYYTVHCVYGADHPEGAGEKLAGVHVLPPPQAQQPDPVQPPGVTITGHDWVPQGARVGLSVRWTSKRYYKKFLVEYWQAGGATPQHEHPGGTSGGFLFSGILPGNNVMVRVEGGNKEYLLWDYSGWTEIRLTAPGTLGVSMRGAIGQPSPLSMRQTTKSLREYMKGKGYPLA